MKGIIKSAEIGKKKERRNTNETVAKRSHKLGPRAIVVFAESRVQTMHAWESVPFSNLQK